MNKNKTNDLTHMFLIIYSISGWWQK